MATLVSFHAHPDDESIQTGGTLAHAARDGHRVVLVFATRGEHGEVAEGVLAPGETLGERRERECHRSGEVLGAARVAFLDYADSGMVGTPENDLPGSFWSADVDEAGERLAGILREEGADVLTIYDDNGIYGHPDHIQVHRVGVRAAERSAVPVVAQHTINRDWMVRGMRRLVAAGQADGSARLPAPDAPRWGRPERLITHRVDVADVADRKRAAMRAHASQMGPDHFMLTMPDAMFALGMGTEFYIVDPVPNPASAPEVFEELFISLR